MRTIGVDDNARETSWVEVPLMMSSAVPMTGNSVHMLGNGVPSVMRNSDATSITAPTSAAGSACRSENLRPPSAMSAPTPNSHTRVIGL